jgi:NADPH-dependent methylglyoxal reductase
MTKTTILLTGATGSLGASTLDQLLADPSFIVHTVLRSTKKSEAFLRNKYATQVASGQLSFVEIPDMAVPGAFDEPALNVDAIMHIATPLAYDNLLEKLIKPSWEILENVLTAAEKSGGRVKRVIVTGSLVSTMRIPADLFSGSTITEENWNPITLAEAQESLVNAYQYSKVFAEQQAWKFMKEKHRAFDLIFLLAPSITGRSLHEGFKPEKGALGGQPGLYKGLFDVDKPGFLFPIFA